MKKIALMIVALLSTTLCMAQHEQQKEQTAKQPMSAEQMTEKMVSDLGLNSKQTKKVKKLNEKYASVLQHPEPKMRHFGGNRPPRKGSFDKNNKQEQPKMNADEKKERPQRPQITEELKEKMKEMRAQREAYEKELKSILTDEQYKKYQNMRPKHGKKGNFRKLHRGPQHHKQND